MYINSFFFFFLLFFGLIFISFSNIIKLSMKQHATAAISILIVLLIQNTAAEHATPNRLQRIGNAARFALPDHATHAPPLAACKRLLSAYTAPASIAKPPPELPEDLQPAFTLNGTIPVAKYFVDDTYGGEGSHYSFPQAQIQQLIDRLRDQLAQRWPEIHPDQPLPELLKNRGPALPNSKTPPRQTPEQQHKDRYVLAATKYLTHLQGAKTLVFGSTEPWFEALLLAAGASHVTTLEYNRLTYGRKKKWRVVHICLRSNPFFSPFAPTLSSPISAPDHPDITTLRPQEFQSSLQEFDVAVSASR